MSVKIPEGYPLDPGVDREVLASSDYRPWTVRDLRRELEDVPDDATVWIGRYDAGEDDIFIRPWEHFAVEQHAEPFVML